MFSENQPICNRNLEHQHGRIYHGWHYSLVVIASIWDTTTLLLYLNKIRTFRKIYQNEQIQRKILFILYRIVIITVFYQITMVLLSMLYGALPFICVPSHMDWYWDPITKIIEDSSVSVWLSILLSFCMYLMMEHNTTTYVRFLRCLHVTHFKYLYFCCFHRMVDHQLEELDSPIAEYVSSVPPGSSSICDTANLSTGIQYRTEMGLGISPDTETKVDSSYISG